MATIGSFKTALDTKFALSAAFSAQFNSRGVESSYTPAWISTLRDALAFSNRFIVATEPYLWIPGETMQLLELNTKYDKLVEKRRHLEAASKNVAKRSPLSSRHSERVQKRSLAKNTADLTQVNDRLSSVDEKIRHQFLAPKKSGPSVGTNKWDSDFSFDLDTLHDQSARGGRPDISVSHIVGGTISITMEDVQKRYPNEDKAGLQHTFDRLTNGHLARAGVKVVHRCAPLIGEFKRVYKRSAIEIVRVETTNFLIDDSDAGDETDDGSNWVESTVPGIVEAANDIMYYAAVYFLMHPLSSETVGLASSGPFWLWALITRDQLPTFDWVTKKPVDTAENHALVEVFLKSFGTSHYTLATPESDNQINLMVRQISRIADDCQSGYPPFPTDFSFELLPDAPRNIPNIINMEEDTLVDAELEVDTGSASPPPASNTSAAPMEPRVTRSAARKRNL